MTLRTLRAFAPALVWALIVWLIGGMQSVPRDGFVTRLDKVAHFGIYGVLGWLCGRGWTAVGRPVHAAFIIVLALVLGAGDEWRQAYTAARSASFMDWLADAAGVITGFFLAVLTARQRRHT